MKENDEVVLNGIKANRSIGESCQSVKTPKFHSIACLLFAIACLRMHATQLLGLSSSCIPVDIAVRAWLCCLSFTSASSISIYKSLGIVDPCPPRFGGLSPVFLYVQCTFVHLRRASYAATVMAYATSTGRLMLRLLVCLCPLVMMLSLTAPCDAMPETSAIPSSIQSALITYQQRLSDNGEELGDV